MGDQFLLNFSKLKINSPPTTTAQYNNTLPPNDCQNGIIIPEYKGDQVLAWKVLYSQWVANQSKTATEFSSSEYFSQAPGCGLSCPTRGPANIFFIRHGEKDSTGVNYKLNGNGIGRACQLVDYINTLAESGFPISYIITCNPCGYNTQVQSMRPQQTIMMSTFMLDIPLLIYGDMNDFNAVTTALFNLGIPPPDIYGGPFDGLNVLICWERVTLQKLILAILDTASDPSINRLPPGINNALDFFESINPCPDGNFRNIDNTSPYFTDVTNENYKYTPYWQEDNYDNIFLLSSGSNYIFNNFQILSQTCLTCYASCNLKIGLYQAPPTNACDDGNLYISNSDPTELSCVIPSGSGWIQS